CRSGRSRANPSRPGLHAAAFPPAHQIRPIADVPDLRGETDLCYIGEHPGEVPMPRDSDSHYTRREWLRLGGLGVFGLSLPRLLQAGEASRQGTTARSCVLFFLHGGPSQLDTWDMKPAAPDNIRGEFKPVATSVPGIHICEYLPRLAQRVHRYTIIRSMTHTAINHNTATYTVTTGHPPLRDLIAFT